MLFAGQVVVHGALRLGRADRVGKTGAKEHRALHQVRKVIGLHVGELAKPLVLPRSVWVEPTRVIANALVGNLVRAKLVHLAVIREEGVEDARLGNEVVVECATGNAHATTLRRTIHVDA